MRLVFYPAIIGWFLIGVWIDLATDKNRSLEEKIIEIENE